MVVKKGFSLDGASLFGANTDILSGGGACFGRIVDENGCEREVNSKRATCLMKSNFMVRMLHVMW